VNADRFVIHSSALMTLIEAEAGADRGDIARSSPWVALMEVYYVTKQEREQVEADRRQILFKPGGRRDRLGRGRADDPARWRSGGRCCSC
jgi:hypothetical protein